MDVLKICIVKLLFTASNFVIPFAALFISKHYEFSVATTATMVTFLSVCYLGGNLAGGYLGDKFQSKSLLAIFSFLSFVLMIISSLQAPAMLTIAAISIFSFLAGAANPVLSNFLSNTVGESNRESAFGNLYLAHNFGIAIVFIVGGFLLDRDSSYPIYFFTGVAGLCFLCTLLLLKQNDLGQSVSHLLKTPQGKSGLPVLIFCSFILFFGLAFLDAQREYQLPVWLDSLSTDTSAAWFGTIGIINAVVVLALTKSVIKATSRFNPISNMGLAAVFYGVGFGLHYLCNSLYPVLALVVLWSIGEILGSTYMNVFISKNAPGHYRAKLFSLIPVVLTVGKILSISTTTQIASSQGIASGWLLALAVGIASMLFSVVVIRFTFKAYTYDKTRNSSAAL